MQDIVYSQVTNAIARRGGGLPAVRCKEFDAVIDDLFTEEEALLVVQMPDDPVTVEKLVASTGRDVDKVRELLEAMASKGKLMSVDRDASRFYLLMPLLPGLYEFHFIMGAKDDRARQSARRFLDYVEAVEKMETNRPGLYPKVPWARVIPVNMDITANMQVKTYDQIKEYINKTEHIGISNCFCRHMGALLDDPCTKPLDVCMSFGPGARFLADRGFGKLISKAEAMVVLERSEEAGLIHCASNTGDYIDFICNCCTCHCHILRNVRSSSVPSFAAVSSFIAEVDPENCTGCEACIDGCAFGALLSEADVVRVDKHRCIGCGLCRRTCPTDAIVLKPRPDAPVPMPNTRKLNQSMLDSKISGR